MKEKMYLRVVLDIDISHEESAFIKETFKNTYNCREITFLPSNNEEDHNSDIDITVFESVDQIIAKELTAIKSENFDTQTLMSIYSNL